MKQIIQDTLEHRKLCVLVDNQEPFNFDKAKVFLPKNAVIVDCKREDGKKLTNNMKVYSVNQIKYIEPTKMRRRNRGFTLVELIVVLTILAILASMLIPALTGYINKAKDSLIVSKARSLLTASQTVVSSNYAKSPAFDRSTKYFNDNGLSDEIIALSEIKGEFECSIGVDERYKVASLYYSENDIAAYYNGEWKVLESAKWPSDTPIVIKGNKIQVPGSYFTNLANSGAYTNEYDLTLLLSIEEMERQAIQKYQDAGLSGKYAYKIKFNGTTPSIVEVQLRDIQTRHYSTANTVVQYSEYYIVVDGNTVGTNVVIDPDTKDVRANIARLRIDRWNNEFYGFDMQPYQ